MIPVLFYLSRSIHYPHPVQSLVSSVTFVCTWIVAPLPSSVVGDVLASLPLLAQLLALTQAGDPGRLLQEAAAAAVLPGLVLQENVLGAGAVEWPRQWWTGYLGSYIRQKTAQGPLPLTQAVQRWMPWLAQDFKVDK